MKSTAIKSVLVIGFGNTLRGDDGAGYQIAETVLEWELEGVRSRSVHQLTPDLAAEIAEFEQVIFVDAIALDPQMQAEIPEPVLERLEPYASATFTGHYANPRSLLSLTQILYQKSPIAYRLLIPAFNFEFGESFSEMTQQSVEKALAKLQHFLVS